MLKRYSVIYMDTRSKQLRDDVFTVDTCEMDVSAPTFRMLAAGHEYTLSEHIEIHHWERIEGP